MTAVVGIGMQLVASGVLLVAGAQKLASPRQFTQTLRALRLPGVAVLARAVPVFELAAAVLLLTGFARPVAAVLTAALGLSFGAAGLTAIRSRTRIPCACFGPRDSGMLGVRQVALVPVWLLVSAGALYLPAISAAAGVVAFITMAQAAGLLAAGYLMAPRLQAWRLSRVVTPR
jgi:hypothetical protein